MTKSILKELAKIEKEGVKLRERKNFLNQKQEKLHKAIQKVRVQYISEIFTVQFGALRTEQPLRTEAAAAIKKFRPIY